MTPRCSIVIPVHNKATLTRQCLDSISEHSPQVAFETVVVDDASTDSTPALLEGYGDAVKPVRLDQNAGFATACNAGAAASRSEFILFLNNDTIALDGWLDALVRYADEHAEATVVGSKLLFPDDTIQHAGVVFTLAGDPLHLYAGCSPAYPAVNKSRRFQAVTAACLLIRRPAFEEVDGFDTGYHNDLEDVDLCLRLGERGHEVHYCHESVLYHLESVSRGQRNRPKHSARRYRARWGGKVRSDELDYYVADGLLDTLRVSPERVDLGGRKLQHEAELMQLRSRQVLDLLRKTVRLATYSGDFPEAGARTLDGTTQLARADAVVAGGGGRRTKGPPRRVRREIEKEMQRLRSQLAGEAGAAPPGNGRRGRPRTHAPLHRADDPATPRGPAAPGAPGTYRGLVADIPRVVRALIPEGSTVLVVSKGDDALLELGDRQAWHFPRAEDGRYRGYYPQSSEDAIEHLEALRSMGAQYLVLPATYLWWLEYYPALGQLLEGTYGLVARNESCRIYDLREPQGAESDNGSSGGRGTEGDGIDKQAASGAEDDSAPRSGTSSGAAMSTSDYQDVVARVTKLVDSKVPPGSTVLVATKGDDALLAFHGRRGWHFPRAEDGRYLGYHPASSADAVAHLEELRSMGAEYLVFPSTALWWLDHYAAFGEHIRARYTAVVEDGAGVVFELVERLVAGVVESLLPEDAQIAIFSPEAAAAGSNSADAGASATAVAWVDDASRRGVQFLVIPRSAFDWLAGQPPLRDYLSTHHEHVTRQANVCEIYELRQVEQAHAGEAPVVDQGGDPPEQPEIGEQGGGDSATSPQARTPGFFARLFGGDGGR